MVAHKNGPAKGPIARTLARDGGWTHGGHGRCAAGDHPGGRPRRYDTMARHAHQGRHWPAPPAPGVCARPPPRDAADGGVVEAHSAQGGQPSTGAAWRLWPGEACKSRSTAGSWPAAASACAR
jgi:hypothetical protein